MIAQFPHLKEFDQSDWRSLYAEVISPIVSSPQGVLDCEELSASVANASLVIASAAFLTAVAGCAYLVLPPLIIGCTAVAMAAYIASAVLITSEYYLCVMECQEDECVSNCPSGQ